LFDGVLNTVLWKDVHHSNSVSKSVDFIVYVVMCFGGNIMFLFC